MEQNIFKFKVEYLNDLHNNSIRMDDSVQLFITINPHDKKINILVSQLFFRDDPKIYPEEYQILMIEKLNEYLTTKDKDGRTDFQKDHPEISTEFDILKMISEFDFTITQKHVVNPKTLILTSHDAKNKTLGKETNFVSMSPNISNSRNLILHLNQMLQRAGYEVIILNDDIKKIVMPGEVEPEITFLGHPVQCCIHFNQRITGDEVQSLELTLKQGSKKTSDSLPSQYSMSTAPDQQFSDVRASAVSSSSILADLTFKEGVKR
jgi:hypothetical protein